MKRLVAVGSVGLLCCLLVACSADDEVGANGENDVNQQQNQDDGDVVDDADDGEDVGEDAGEDAGGDADVGEPDADAGNDDEYEPPEGMVFIEEGTFTRGCNVELDDECNEDDPDSIIGYSIPYKHENPPHEVTLSAYAIDIHEVTEQQYQECVDDGVCDEPFYDDMYDGHGPDYPVVNVTAGDAMDYCEWADKRLPTEAEWEKAARGDDQRIYPWGNEEPDCDRANYDDCGGEMTPVGEHPAGASPFGVEDMAGNVRNWTADWFDAEAYDEDPVTDPEGPDSGNTRTVRGGSFAQGASSLRTSARYSMEGDSPESFGFDTGFRCAKGVEQ